VKIGIRHWNSGPSETRRYNRCSSLRLRVRVVVGMVALLVCIRGPLCFGSPSPRSADCVEEVSTAKTEVPFELYNDNLIIVRATIGAIKNVNMILDTGTSPSAISKEMADRLKVRGKTETLQTLNGPIQAQSIILPHIQIGTWRGDFIRVVVQDLSFMERSLGIPLGGIAGLDILGTGSFTIDYRRRKIVLGAIAASAKQIRFETQVPLLTVTLKIEGQEVRLLVDSGTWGLLVYRNRLRTAQSQLRFNTNASISTAGGMTQVRWFRAVVSLGKDNMGTRSVAIADVDPDPQNGFDGLLGFAKMGFRKVSFDFENGLFGWE
jgi:predicted aspartyl protease